MAYALSVSASRGYGRRAPRPWGAMAAESPVASATASTRPAASSDSGKVFGTPAWYPLPVLLPIQLAPVALPDLDNDPGTDGSDCAICAISCQEKYGAQLNPGTSWDWRGSEGHMEGYACIFLKYLEKNMAQPQTPCLRARMGLKTPVRHLRHGFGGCPTHARACARAHAVARKKVAQMAQVVYRPRFP